MSRYRVELLAPSALGELVPLMRHCFAMEVDEKYFRWKYLENPAGPTLAFVAKDERGDVVAHEGLMPLRYSIGGESRTIHQSTDTMTHASHRRQGLFKLLARAGYDHLGRAAFVTGFGGEMSTPMLVSFGWHHVAVAPFYFRTWPQAKLATMRRKRAPASYTVEPVPSGDNGPLLSLAGAARNRTDAHIVLDDAFVGWKLRNPRFDYRTVVVRDASARLRGYLTYYLEGNRVMLFDIWADEDRSAESALFRWLDELVVRGMHKGIVIFAQRHRDLAARLLRHGFVTNPFRRGPLHRPLPFMVYWAAATDIERYGKACAWSTTPWDHDAV